MSEDTAVTLQVHSSSGKVTVLTDIRKPYSYSVINYQQLLLLLGDQSSEKNPRRSAAAK